MGAYTLRAGFVAGFFQAAPSAAEAGERGFGNGEAGRHLGILDNLQLVLLILVEKLGEGGRWEVDGFGNQGCE